MPSGRTWAFVKIAASIALVYLAIDLYANDSHTSYGYGVKAALLAFGAAVSLFYELIPNGNERIFRLSLIASWSTRIVGAGMATLAAWNLLLDETGGDPLPLLGPMAVVAGVALVVPIAVLIDGMPTDRTSGYSARMRIKDGQEN